MFGAYRDSLITIQDRATREKYKVVIAIDTATYGGSAGIIPSHVNRMNVTTILQKVRRPIGENTIPPLTVGVISG